MALARKRISLTLQGATWNLHDKSSVCIHDAFADSICQHWMLFYHRNTATDDLKYKLIGQLVTTNYWVTNRIKRRREIQQNLLGFGRITLRFVETRQAMPINSSNCKMRLSIVVLISRWILTQIWMKSNTSPMTVIRELCRYFLFFFEYCCNLRQQIRFFLLNEKKPRTHSQAFPVWLGSILTQRMITFFSGLVAVSFNLFSPYIATFSGRLFRSI